MYTIDIDIGSTCTDGFFSSGDEFRLAKVLTTPHDLAECVLSCIQAGADQFGAPDLRSFLRQASVTRLSTTIATNLVVQGAGAKIGLIVTKGNETSLYGSEPQTAAVGTFVAPGLVMGLDEEVDDQGRVVKEATREQVLENIRELVGLGARIIVVSLRNAWRNDRNERLVREYIRERYPAQYLRSVPVQLGTEIIHTSDDHVRTNSAVVNAYVHAEMARTLYRIEDRLRDRGSRRPLLVVHAHGGSGRIAKTVALQTLNSGPAVATHGAARMAELMGIDRVLTVDMGGTSLDAAVIVDHAARLRRSPKLEGAELGLPMVEVESIAGGGSSIAHVDDGVLHVGPRSAGSAPGPASYGRGGTDATLTDANLVLGFIRADFFLGGALALDQSRAERAIERNVGQPLGLDVPAAASAVRAALGDEAAEKLREWIEDRGYKPEEFTLFVLGGNSALHACLLAERLGIDSAVVFPYCSVFSAFGSNTTDVEHRYGRTIESAFDDLDAGYLEDALRGLVTQASRDMAGEGFDPATALGTVEIAIGSNGDSEVRRLAPMDLASADAHTMATELQGAGIGGRQLQSVELVARAGLSHWEPSVVDGASAPSIQPVHTRPIHWDGVGPIDTPVYDESVLRPGWAGHGPLLIETAVTNYAVAPGWGVDTDRWGNLRLVRDAGT